MLYKSFFSKLNFALGRNPVIEKNSDWKQFIPSPYKAVLLISADFELAWAWQYAKSAQGKLDVALEKARLERKNMPELIRLCNEYSLPVTWATVGHLFLESCSKNGLPHPMLLRLPFFENEFWRFGVGDWFQNDPCSNYKDSPEWYCPDLIQMILRSKVKHEIGCHTFSHIDCRDGVCPSEVFDSEIIACKDAAHSFGVELKSFVHPAHSIGNIEKLSTHGFTSFRTDYRNVLGYPIQHKSGIWEIKSSVALYLRKEWSLQYHAYRFKKIIDRAIKSNTVCCMWFHPSVEKEFIDGVLRELLRYIDQRKDEIFISTTADYIEKLNKKC